MSQFDEVAEIYEENLKELLGSEDIEKYAEYKIQLTNILSQKTEGKLMDFGCGTGRSFPYLKNYFPKFELYGCDVSEESIKIAGEHISREHLFVNDSVEALACMGKMDIVIAACVFHHIPPEERKQWISGVVDNLQEDGIFLIFEHNTKNPMTKKIILDPKNLVDDINWMISHENLKEMVKNIPDAKIVWDGYTLFSPWRPKFMTNAERFLKWCPLGAQHCVVIGKR